MMDIFDRCCAIVVVKNQRILLGYRVDGQGWSVAGGKLEKEETLEDAAKRELEEEFGIISLSIESLGRIQSEAYVFGEKKIVKPMVFLCKEFIGTPRALPSEVKNLHWVEKNEILSMKLFPPTKKIIEQLGPIIFKL